MTNLFSQVGDTTLPNPTNQHELVLYTLIFPPAELTCLYWANTYRILKWSNRLIETERRLATNLVERSEIKFTNRFSHKSSYTLYKPILSKSQYIDLYMKLKEIGN